MDFKNLCQNIDVSSLKARIPSMPVMPQIKLPKSLPKLRSRRIFSRSRDNLSRSKTSSSIKEQQLQQQQRNSFHQMSTQSIIPPADFINHTPHRISTISSLMSQGERGGVSRGMVDGTYRSAYSVDDDYPSPRQFQVGGRLSRHMSPIHDVSSINGGGGAPESGAAETTVVKMTFSEKFQKGCKDINEFRLSQIFAKKTVVRKDMIQVDHYVERFNAERRREQAEEERCERKIADNYRFDFKLSRQDTDNSMHSVSSMESSKHRQHTRMLDQSEDESGMEATPPPRKPGIASTRLARVRNPPLEQYISDEESNNELDEDADKVQKALQSSPPANMHSSKETASRTAKALFKLRSLSKCSEETPEKAGEKKRRAPLTPQQSEEQGEQVASNTDNENRFSTLKQNIKRFSKSIKRAGGGTQEDESRTTAKSADDTDGEEVGTLKGDKAKQTSRAERFAARLRKFASHEASTEQLDGGKTATSKNSDVQRSPIRATISNKLQTWKKSFKLKPNEAGEDDGRQMGEETSPEHAKERQRPDSLMKKLHNMRQRKRASSTDELADYGTEDDRNEAASSKKTVNFEERFEKARKRTLKKMNGKMQQINLYKSQEQLDKVEFGAVSKNKNDIEDDGEQSEDEHTGYVRPPARTAARRAAACYTPTDSEEEEEEEEGAHALPSTGSAYVVKDIGNTQLGYDAQLPTRTQWTTKNLLTESFDSETDSDFPRVLIHQDNSDQYESMLIIAVTRPAPAIPTTTPIIIEEIRDIDETRPKPKPPRPSRTPSPGSGRAEWIPNNESISGFLELTPPGKRRISTEAILPPRRHMRNMSLDSNSDSDSWIPLSVSGNSCDQHSRAGSVEGATCGEEPWKVQHTFGEETLYKAESIDIFEASVHNGGVSAAFDDFDEELRNEPVLKVPQQRHVDSFFERDSSEEPFAVDDDNSSRVMRISVSVIREECEEMLDSAESTQLIELPQMSEREFGNSSASLIAHSNEDDNDGYEDDDEDDEVDRPPSAPPSPPPYISPPLPPLPPRKPTLLVSKSFESSSPPPATKAPTAKPPTPPPTKPSAPPRIPERTPSMSRISKPLVKTASLRLAYDEQVNPSDVGKVNKLITRFEISQTNAPPPLRQRPRIIRRRLTRDESEEYSDDKYDLEKESNSEHESLDTHDTERDVTPTPTNTPRTYSLESDTESVRHVCSTQGRTGTTNKKPSSLYLEGANAKSNPVNVRNGNQTKLYNEVPKITLNFDTNSNLSLSCASSEYGSPLEYPSSLIGSADTTPIPERKAREPLMGAKSGESNRRSMPKDEDTFLSFDSDDENSYYSISSTSSSRYVVEI
ncbi:protein PIP82 [Eurosta solidaginis]|uniref:protein PIP82 n=1 Tax=Eurosta solidaginis TaxID=178769 RepID=UPI0035311EF2